MGTFNGTNNCGRVLNQPSFKSLIKSKWGSIESTRNCDIDDKYETPSYIDVEEKKKQTITRVRQPEQREPTIIDLQHEQELRLLYGALYKIDYSTVSEFLRPDDPQYPLYTGVRQSEQRERTIIDLPHENEPRQLYGASSHKPDYSSTPKSDGVPCRPKYVHGGKKESQEEEEMASRLEGEENSEEDTEENEGCTTCGKILVYVPEYDDAGDFEDL